MVKRAILFINGDLASPPQVPLKKKDFLIGVDGGTRLARKLGLKLKTIEVGSVPSETSESTTTTARGGVTGPCRTFRPAPTVARWFWPIAWM